MLAWDIAVNIYARGDDYDDEHRESNLAMSISEQLYFEPYLDPNSNWGERNEG